MSGRRGRGIAAPVTPRQRLRISSVRSRTVRHLGRGFCSAVSGAERSDASAEASAQWCQEQNGQTPWQRLRLSGVRSRTVRRLGRGFCSAVSKPGQKEAKHYLCNRYRLQIQFFTALYIKITTFKHFGYLIVVT